MAWLEITPTGLTKIADALAFGYLIHATRIGVGSGEIAHGAVALVSQQWSGTINAVDVVSGDPSRVRVEALVPAAIGGWTMKEACIYDSDGDVIAVARIADTYKPDPAVDGASVVAYIRLVVEIANAGDAFILTVDHSIVLATRLYVDERVPGSLLYSWEHFT